MTSTKLYNILIFADWYKPGFRAGGPIQSVYNLANLLSKNFHVKVVTRNTDYGSSEAYESIVPDEWQTISPQHEVMYLSAKNTKIKTIKSLCKTYRNDAILINGLFSFYFSILPLFWANYFNVKKIFVAVRGMLHQSALRVKPLKKQIFLAFARGFGLYKKTVLLSTSEFENIEIRKTLGRVNIIAAPNIPIIPLTEVVKSDKLFKENGILRLLFLGRISPEKNPISLIKALMPISQKVQLKFAGAGIDESYFLRFEQALKELPANIRVERLGELNHNQIMNLFNQSDVMVLPSHGENFGHAIFESFVYATPVIIGNNTPWKNIEISKAGIELDSNNIELITDAINKFCNMSQDEYKEWQSGAFNQAIYYLKANDFEKIYSKIFVG